MIDHRIAILTGCVALLAAVGCSHDTSVGEGVTFEQIESDSPANDSHTAALESDTVEPQTGTESETAPNSPSPDESAVADVTTADSATEAEGAPEEVVVEPASMQDAASAETLTPEQEAALAAIQLQPGYEEMLFFKSGDALRVEFDKLDLQKVLNMTYIPTNATDYFPEWMTALDGKQVRLRGFMYTTFDGVSGFLLCRDLGPCCFGPNPRADYRIPVQLREGETTDYIHQIPFDVVGTFHIHLTIDDLGKVGHTYAISDATILRL